MILFIDNYDSFTYNLVQLFLPFYPNIEVVRNDEITIEQIKRKRPKAIIISPGPKDPKHAGISMQVISHFYKDLPILGVCLGMQCINECFKGRTKRAPLPIHGKTSKIIHNGKGLLKGLPTPIKVARYHSLCIELASTSPLRVDAEAEDGVIMGIYYPDYPLYGVQFHPESFLTEYGDTIAKNFLKNVEL